MLAAIKEKIQQLRNPAVLSARIYAQDRRLGRKYGVRMTLGHDRKYWSVRRDRREIRVALEHTVYLEDIARYFDDFHGSVVVRTADDVDIADFSYPQWHIVPGLQKEFFFTSLPESLPADESLVQILRIKEGDVVVDAGAYCGLTTYLFARAAGASGIVIAVEADPRNYQALLSNLKRHAATNVVPINAALWKQSGTLKFAAEGNMGSAASEVGSRKTSEVEVRAVTLDEIFSQAGVARIDHVKMDIEGAEYEVLLASHNFIRKHRPDFVVEVHREGTGPINVDKLRMFFVSEGYEMRHTPQAGDDVYYFHPTEAASH